jgi:hypothetical protein
MLLMKKQMRNFYIFVLAAVVLLSGGCNDPVFWNIAQEEKILVSRIPGSPTRFAEFDGYMYVASGNDLYRYKDRKWDKINPKSGRIASIAATNNKLYILCDISDTFSLRESTNGSDFSTIATQSIPMHSIFTANNTLFIGMGDVNSQYIQYLDNNTLQKVVDTGKDYLCGAVYSGSNYYFCVKDHINANGGNIYTTNNLSTSATPVSGSNNIPFVGIITLPTSNNVVAIDRNGKLYTVTSSEVTFNHKSMGRTANGVLAIWENSGGSGKLLLAGRQDMIASTTSGHTFGYMELEIDNSGIVSTASFVDPGSNTLSTVKDNALYNATLGKLPVNDIFQVQNDVLFASTVGEGVWSYRVRDGRAQWNAEE